MRKTLVTSIITAFGMIGAFATIAAAQNPFSIEDPAIVTDSNNSGVAGAVKVTDPNGSTKELGPINSSATKVGLINRALPRMLGLTNPNGQVDLNAVWTQTQVALNSDVWFYFAWSRDSSNGSGFISIEIQKSAVDPACAYDTATEADLIAHCNPWKNRDAGDFILLWDQQGGSRDIYIRTFTGTKPNLTLGAPQLLTDAFASYSEDGFRGEAAINLTDAGVFSTEVCQSFANTIPGTVTGNSDSADYKDAVLAPFPPISNCGTVIVSKVTVPAGLTGSFPYTVAHSGANIFLGTPDTDCVTSGSSDLTQCKGSLTNDGGSNTIDGLVQGTGYTLAEDTLGGYWQSPPAIACKVDGSSTSYPGTGFPVVAAGTTRCKITNTAMATPTKVTEHSATTKLQDSITITGLLRAAGETAMTVTFKLYSDSGCTTEVGGAGDKLANAGIALYLASGSATSGTASTVNSILVNNGTYYWRVAFSGNNYNDAFTTSCAGEVTTVSVTTSGTGS